MTINSLMNISNNVIELFNKKVYEKFVLNLMNRSQKIFTGTYVEVTEQSCGECDYIDVNTREKFDAKLPFYRDQIELLTSGKKHKAEIEKWIRELQDESAEFNPAVDRDNPDYNIADTKLYKIMKEEIERDKEDENIVFFLPYPITFTYEGSIFLQFASDFLNSIYEKLEEEIEIGKRKIYAVYLSGSKNTFVLRTVGGYEKEFIESDEIEKYISYEIVCAEK